MEAAASDLALVELARGGDREAFEELYRRHIGRVYGLCLRMAGNATEAEELAQEALVRAWRKLDLVPRRLCFQLLASPTHGQRGAR